MERDCLREAAGAHYCSARLRGGKSATPFNSCCSDYRKPDKLVSTKTLIALLAFLTLCAGWWYRDSAPMRSVQAAVKDALPDNSYTTTKKNGDKAAVKSEKPKEAHSLRKCVSDNGTIYTDEKCPGGSREAPISEGNVTVVPGQRPAAKAKSEEKAK
jgi:hypothetical protein